MTSKDSTTSSLPPTATNAGKKTRIYIAGALVLFALIYVGSLFSPGLQDDADSTHAEAAREMSVTHDYVTLKVNGNRYLEKAPLMYWAVSVCYVLFGTKEFAAHLPVALSMLLLVLLAMRWGRRAFGDRAAVYAGLFVATTVGCYLFTRILIPESILSLFIAASVLFLRHRSGRRRCLALVWRLRLCCAGRAHQGLAGYRCRGDRTFCST